MTSLFPELLLAAILKSGAGGYETEQARLLSTAFADLVKTSYMSEKNVIRHLIEVSLKICFK